jgi:hypothetical protein
MARAASRTLDAALEALRVARRQRDGFKAELEKAATALGMIPIGCVAGATETVCDDLLRTKRERDEAREAINAVRGVNVDAIVERDEAQAKARAFEAGWRLAEADARRLRELGTEIVGHFWQHGHPGAPCLRTGWVGVGAVAEWRAALATDDTTTPRSARQAADERAEDGER